MRPLSLVFPVSDSPECTPSVKAYGFATFPKGTAFRCGGKLSGIAKRRPLGGAGERSETEGVKKHPRRHKPTGVLLC